MADIDDLRKLSPEERIRRLRELEEKRKKEIEEAEEIIKASETELEERKELEKKVPIPQMKAMDLGDLFSEAEQEMVAVQRGESSAKPGVEGGEAAKPEEAVALEETVAAEKPKLTPAQADEQQRAYQMQLAKTPMDELNEKIQNVYQQFKQAQDEGTVGYELVEQAKNFQYAMQEKQKAMREGVYNAPQAIEDQVRADKQMVDKILNWYKA